MAATQYKSFFAPVRLPGEQHQLADYGYHRSELIVALFDRCEVPTGVEANSVVYAGDVSLDFVPIRELSVFNFDDAGTSVTLSFGDALHPTALVNGQDIAAAAGSASLLKSVDIASDGDPLWKLLGWADRDAAVLALGGAQVVRLIFTFGGSTTSAATSLAWKLIGTRA